MMKKLFSVLMSLTVLLLLNACGNEDEKENDNSSSTAATVGVTTTSTPPTTTELVIEDYKGSVYNIYKYFKENCSFVDKYIEYTEDNDPNKNIGSEGNYTQKINFSFNNLSEDMFVLPDLGGTIEIFNNETDAKNKANQYKNESETLEFSVFPYKNILLRISVEIDKSTISQLEELLKDFVAFPKDYTSAQDSKKDEEVHPFSDPENFKKKCKEIGYKEIARDNQGLKGQCFKFTGEVIQVLDGVYRMNVTKDDYGIYSDTIMFTYVLGNENRILEKDIVTIWGRSMGLITYETVLGNELTIPEIDAKYIVIEGE